MNTRDILDQVREYTVPNLGRSLTQIANTLLPYLALWVVMVYSVTAGWPYWTTFLLILPASAFLVRLFILFHDCTHQSFFKSRKANRLVGTIFGVMTLTPYDSWASDHLAHHATVADLDNRGIGDVWTMTVSEYENASKALRLGYRLVRNPFVMFGLGPIWVFMIKQRFFFKGSSRRAKINVVITNLALLAIMAIFYFTVGVKTYLIIQLPIMYIAGAAGIWLFYVQHQFDPTHWSPHEQWDFLTASLKGSSYYKLPKVLQWLSGNIGLHHVHHINALIPNYNLQPCLDNTPFLREVPPITILDSLKTVRMNLWDEAQQRLVSFRSLKKAS